MAQTTRAMSGRSAYIAWSTGGTTFTDISGWSNSVNVDGGERNTGSAFTADTDTPIVLRGKREPLGVTVRALYTEVSTDPYKRFETAYEGASDFYIRWAPAGNTSGNMQYTTSAGTIKSPPYQAVEDVGDGEALVVEMELECASITEAVIA